MAIHFRMIDALSEAHMMAMVQKKYDLAEVLLQAIELEQEKYGKDGEEDKRLQSMNMLNVAKERQASLSRQFSAGR